ncbi:MAG: carboxypeptidase regulatory-like domain-containing protein [Bryobacteraceae bacterium]|jgi:protocatechuate 3,4-dioxygenase beta subunit
MSRVLTVMLLAVSAGMAQTGSIGGVVYDAGTGKPLADVNVFVSQGNVGAHTDAQGHYTLRGLNPGRYTVSAFAADGQRHAFKAITVAAGQDIETVDFHLPGQTEISGKVLDENKEPMSGMAVFLVAREYSLGTLRYVFAGMAATDDQGEYRLQRVEPGRAYLVMAGEKRHQLDTISSVPMNPKLRKPALIPTYYPDTPSIEGAQPVVLRAGERREGMDIHMSRGPSYCIDGVLETGGGPGALHFFIGARQPTSGASGDGGFFTIPPGGITRPDGKIRICDLSPGEYQIMALQSPLNQQKPPVSFGTGVAAIADKDAHNVRVQARPLVHLSGEVVWAATPPDKPVESKLSIWLEPLTRTQWQGETTQTESSIPGDFSLPSLLMDDFMVRLHGLSGGMYFKDITYAGVSILHEPLRLGSAMGNASLRVVLARDGGFVAVMVRDKDGNPVPDSYVLVMPADSNSEASLGDTLISGQTDQNGTYTSVGLAPGKYYVLASTVAIDKSPENISTLWHARSRGTEIGVEPNATVQLTLTPTTLN